MGTKRLDYNKLEYVRKEISPRDVVSKVTLQLEVYFIGTQPVQSAEGVATRLIGKISGGLAPDSENVSTQRFVVTYNDNDSGVRR